MLTSRTFILLCVLMMAGCSKSSNPNGGGGATAPTGPTVYYVSPSGSDANNGTSASTPWQTIAKVNSATLSPGVQVLFEGGQTFTGNLVISASGTSASLIDIGSYGTGKASINAGTGTGIYIHNQGYIRISNLTVYGGWDSGTQTGNNGSGIWFYVDQGGSVQLGDCLVFNCDVSGFQTAGIEFQSTPSDGSQSGYKQLTADSNAVHGNGLYGMIAFGNQGTSGSTAYAFPAVRVAFNTVYDNLGLSAKTDNHSGDGILIGDAGSGTIEHNIAYHNGWLCGSNGGGPAGIWCYDSKGLVFQYNESYDNGTGPGKADGDGFDLDGGSTYCVMQYNYSHDNYAAGYLTWEYGDTRIHNSTNVVRYNISQNDASGNSFYGSMVVGPNCTFDEYYNNTVFNNTQVPIVVYGGGGNAFANNILWGNGAAGVVYCSGDTNTARFLNNDYYSGTAPLLLSINGSAYTSLTSLRASYNEVYGGINYGFSVDPGLTGAGSGGTIGTGTPAALTSYQLSTGSPMLHVGLDLTTLGLNVGTTDFNGVAIPYGGYYNIGACN
jgi:hypothetical protein